MVTRRATASCLLSPQWPADLRFEPLTLLNWQTLFSWPSPGVIAEQTVDFTTNSGYQQRQTVCSTQSYLVGFAKGPRCSLRYLLLYVWMDHRAQNMISTGCFIPVLRVPMRNLFCLKSPRKGRMGGKQYLGRCYLLLFCCSIVRI